MLKSKVPVETSMSGNRLRRSGCAVRAYLTNGILDKADLKLLRDNLKQVGVGGKFSCVDYFGGFLNPVPRMLFECCYLQLSITVTDS